MTYLQTGMYLREHTNLENQMASASTNGKMAVCMLVISKKDLNMDRENGERGLMLRTATLTKAPTKETRKMEWALLHGRVVISIKAATKTMSGTDMEKCTGLTDLVTRENGSMEFNMELAEWSFQMVELRRVFLKTISLKDQQLVLRNSNSLKRKNFL